LANYLKISKNPFLRERNMSVTPQRQSHETRLLAAGGRSGRPLTGVEGVRDAFHRGTSRCSSAVSHSPLSETGKRAAIGTQHEVVDLSGPQGNELEGFRLVDVSLLSEFVATKLACKDCVRGLIQSQLASFVESLKAGGSFSTDRGLNRALQNYSIPARIVASVGMKLKSEVVSGFASTLTFGCSKGHEIEFLASRDIITGKNDRGRKPEVNLRLALAFINLGKGATHLYRMAAHLNMNIPTNFLDGKSFARCESTLGPHIEACARKTCAEALAATIAVEESKEGPTPSTTYNGKTLVNIPVSVDMGWVKRSSGNRYDPDSGIATAIEQNNGKIVEFEIKAKHCNKCELQKVKQPIVSDADWQQWKKAHDCKENWGGKSSKSMEAGAVCAMAMRAPQGRAKFTPIISDDDSSMRAWMTAVDPSNPTGKGLMPDELAVEKFLADPSHRTKVFAKGLYAMASRSARDKPGYGEEATSTMNKEVAAKMKQYHAYVLGQHKDKTAQELRDGLLNMVAHSFDDHGKCGDWYPAKQAKAKGITHAPTGFVRKEYLRGATLKAAIHAHVEKFAGLETCAESTHPYHSQGNEASNQRASSKAPKNTCYGRTGSYTRRVSLCVAEHNVGVQNNETIMELLDIVPGVHMKRLLSNYQQKVDRKALQSKSLEGKQVRKWKSSARIVQSRKENPTNAADYGSGMGFGMGRAAAPFVQPGVRRRGQKRPTVTNQGSKGKYRLVGPSSDGQCNESEDSAGGDDGDSDAAEEVETYGPSDIDESESDEEEVVLNESRSGRKRKRPAHLDD
jgi:hypothetical protein